MTTLSGTELNKKPPNTKFSPNPNVPYKLLFQEMNNNIVEMIITFTEKNNIYPVERCFGFKPYEGYDEYGSRFVCYVCYIDKNYIVLHSCVPLVTLNCDTKVDSFDIKKIYSEDELIWSV